MMNGQKMVMRIFQQVMLCTVVVGGGLAMGGCQTRVVSETRAPWHWAEEINAERNAGRGGDDAVLNSGGPGGDGGGAWGSSGGLAAETDWTIAVDAFEGRDREAVVQRKISELEKATLLRDWWTEDSNGQTVLYFGRYDSPQGRQARADMRILKELAEDGRLAVEQPLLAFYPIEAQGGGGQMDLRSVSGVGSYTLQIGFYEGEGRQKAAEEAAKVLRDDGFDAFFYHGPNLSQLTVGVFRDDEVRLVAANPGNMENSKLSMYYSPRVERLRERFPNNLGNGRELIETVGDEKRVQPSFIVKIP